MQTLPSDPVLPHLASLFDMVRTAQICQAVMQGSASVRGCEIERVKYRPRRNCVVGYRVQVQSESGGMPQALRFCAAMYGAHEVRGRYEKALTQAHSVVRYGAPVSLITALDAVLWAFPNDRKLPALPLLADADQLRSRLLPRLDDASVSSQSNHTIVSYFPEHTCCVSLEVDLRGVSGKLFAKTRYDDAGAHTYTAMRALWRSTARRDGLIHYAEPLHYDAEHRLLWQAGVAGQTLSTLLERADAALLQRVGRALAALHATPIETARSFTAETIFAAMQRAEKVIARACPQHAQPTQALLHTLHQRAGAIDFSPHATLHGDLHSNNILVSGSSVALIDFDRLSKGPALAELGSCVAELLYRAALQASAAPLAQIKALVQGYREAAAWPLAPEALQWHAAAALIHERAYRCVTSLKPGRWQAIPALLEYARQMLAGELRLLARTPRRAKLASAVS